MLFCWPLLPSVCCANPHLKLQITTAMAGFSQHGYKRIHAYGVRPSVTKVHLVGAPDWQACRALARHVSNASLLEPSTSATAAAAAAGGADVAASGALAADAAAQSYLSQAAVVSASCGRGSLCVLGTPQPPLKVRG